MATTSTANKSSTPNRSSIGLDRSKQREEEETPGAPMEYQFQNSEVDEPLSQSMETCKKCSQHQVQTANEFLNKLETLRYALETDLLACDAKWTLFVAAALSYRYDSKLEPFPPRFATEQSGYNINALVSVINDTPKLRVILQNIVDQNYHEFSIEVIELLYWVLITMREPSLRLVSREVMYAILSSIDEKSTLLKPTHVFEVNALTGFHSDVGFRDQISDLPVKFAFWGNKLDSYFSVIYNGFSAQFKNKEPIELTTDLQTSLKFSPNDPAWGASQCGSIISCTAICELAYDIDTDKIITNNNEKSCVNIHLENPKNIRLRYLLFYGSRLPNQILPQRRLLSWIYHHKYYLSLISYMLLLVSIGVANSGSGSSLKVYMTRKFESILDLYERMLITLQRYGNVSQ